MSIYLFNSYKSWFVYVSFFGFLVCVSTVISGVYMQLNLFMFCSDQHSLQTYITFYNTTSVNSQHSLAKSWVDITYCQHWKFSFSQLFLVFAISPMLISLYSISITEKFYISYIRQHIYTSNFIGSMVSFLWKKFILLIEIVLLFWHWIIPEKIHAARPQRKFLSRCLKGRIKEFQDFQEVTLCKKLL